MVPMIQVRTKLVNTNGGLANFAFIADVAIHAPSGHRIRASDLPLGTRLNRLNGNLFFL